MRNILENFTRELKIFFLELTRRLSLGPLDMFIQKGITFNVILCFSDEIDIFEEENWKKIQQNYNWLLE